MEIDRSGCLEDSTLASRAAQGDQEAFTLLIERYRRYIYTIAYKIALNEEDALDITQNVYARLVEKIGEFEGRGSFRSWLAVIASREAVSFLRRPGRREEPAAPDVIEELADSLAEEGIENVRAALDAEQRLRLVEQAMKSLSPQQRAIMALRLGEDMGPKEIAERLNLPASQVRSQLNRAIERIRKILAEEIV
jgi:RNA polymerase sigma factor (sigma-70 family)